LTVTIETVAETGSTNADLLARLRTCDQLAEGFWLRAERQTGGKGREGREWVSPAGNLYVSTLVELQDGDPSAHSLAFVAGLAVWRTLRDLLPENADIMLKWPNDVLVSGSKIAGILLERQGDFVVAGIGVNVAEAPGIPGRATTSIAAETSQVDSDADAVLDALAREFAVQVSKWRSQGLAATLSDWAEAAHPVGTPLSTTMPGGEAIQGTFDGLEKSGALRLRLPDGSTHAIHAGDVMLEAE